MKYITYSIRFEGKETHWLEEIGGHLVESRYKSLLDRVSFSNRQMLVNFKEFDTMDEAKADLDERKLWVMGNGVIYR